MPEYITYKTKGGLDFIPEFVMFLDSKKCMGCGRCYKVCPQNVMNLKVMEEDDEDIDFTYMELINDHLCIGCKACQKACPKGCFVHKPLEVKNDQI
ncbi:MAG: hypothetical protein PWQ25_1085 [Deferribacteres bacterium]|jgi:Nif-specific ferredoxin III|nr:ferredoxin nif-specific [Deferribacteraceae bacterium]MDK2792222.1 hypothetical protein [Deferribacteres bacterium]